MHRFSVVGGTGIVLRFGWFYGRGAAHSEQLFALARRHVGLVLGPPGSYVSSIHVADAGAAAAAALHAAAGTFNIVDDEPLTKREYADALARCRCGNGCADPAGPLWSSATGLPR